MKNLKTIISVFFLIALFSCSKDFLEKSDPMSLTPQNFYKNATEIDQAINGIYGLLQNIVNYQYALNELVTDNTTVDFNPDSRSDANRHEALDYFTYNPAVIYFENAYRNYYNMLQNINLLLQKISNNGANISVEFKNQSVGQLLFLRAYSYFELTQYFGDVVLLTEPIKTSEEAYGYSRTPQDEVWKKIESDLKEASLLLPSSYDSDNIGRVTKGAALTLLGKVYLTRKKYSDAISALNKVLSLGYSLLPNYADIFDPNNKNNAESIFEIQYQGGNDLGEESHFVYIFAPRKSGGQITGWPQSNPYGFNIPTNDLIDSYEDGDLRLDASIGQDFISPETGLVVPYIKKYAHPHSIYYKTDDNWPVLRYADVLLMLAEAINEVNGPTSQAYDYINQVRSRAGLDPLGGLDQGSFREKALHERRVELAFENWRWFDLKRTMTPAELTTFLNAYGAKEKANPTVSRQGIPFSEADYHFSEYEYYYPLPASEIAVSDKLEQNPGYH